MYYGFDIGGTKIALGVFDNERKLQWEKRVPTPVCRKPKMARCTPRMSLLPVANPCVPISVRGLTVTFASITMRTVLPCLKPGMMNSPAIRW